MLTTGGPFAMSSARPSARRRWEVAERKKERSTAIRCLQSSAARLCPALVRQFDEDALGVVMERFEGLRAGRRVVSQGRCEGGWLPQAAGFGWVPARGKVISPPDWRPAHPVWQNSGVARSSTDAARLPPGGPEASPTVLVGPYLGRTYGNLPGSVSTVPVRHSVDTVPGDPRKLRGIFVMRRFMRSRATRPTAWVGRNGNRATGFQSVTREQDY
jgi:hypothetical protein